MTAIPLLALSCSLMAATPQDAAPPDDVAQTLELTARLVSSRPLVRPGEWFPIVFVVETTTGEPARLGPPDDGLKPLEGAEERDTRLSWVTEDDDEFRLVPDLTSMQWPRTVSESESDTPSLTLPLKVYVPIKAISKATVGPAQLTFRLKGSMITGTGEAVSFTPVDFEREVSLEIVHPTDPDATDLSLEDPSLFFDWMGDLPDWSVQDTREQRPKRPAPLLAWMLFVVPVVAVGCAVTWAFATKRM